MSYKKILSGEFSEKDQRSKIIDGIIREKGKMEFPELNILFTQMLSMQEFRQQRKSYLLHAFVDFEWCRQTKPSQIYYIEKFALCPFTRQMTNSCLLYYIEQIWIQLYIKGISEDRVKQALFSTNICKIVFSLLFVSRNETWLLYFPVHQTSN